MSDLTFLLIGLLSITIAALIGLLVARSQRRLSMDRVWRSLVVWGLALLVGFLFLAFGRSQLGVPGLVPLLVGAGMLILLLIHRRIGRTGHERRLVVAAVLYALLGIGMLVTAGFR